MTVMTHVRRALPSVLTLLAVAVGASSMVLALQHQWQAAVAAVSAAAILDGLDGRVARFLGVSSQFGAELDSLADVINFGVAPAFIIYLWGLHTAGVWGWVAVLFFIMCCMCRLARFNTLSDGVGPPTFSGKYFVGVPALGGAIFVLMPMMASFEPSLLPLATLWRTPVVLCLWVLIGGLLLVMTAPVCSIKYVRVGHAPVWLLVLVGLLVTGGLVLVPWYGILVLGGGYVASVPFAYWRYARDLRRWQVSGLEDAKKEPQP